MITTQTTTWLTETDSYGDKVSHVPGCTNLTPGAQVEVEAEPSGWLCTSCIEVDVIPSGVVNGPSVDAPYGNGQGVGTGRRDGCSEKQRALVDRLCAQLDRTPPTQLTKKSASEWIDMLLEQVRAKEAAEAAKVDQLTDDEVEGFLTGLGRKVEVSEVTPALRAWATRWAKDYAGDFSFMLDMKAAAERGTLSPAQAKGTLNCARAEFTRRPRKTTTGATTHVEIEEGFYELDGEVYKVQVAVHGSGNLYGKRLNVESGKFDYEQGVVGKLARGNAERLTLERAKELGHLYGVCMVCGRTLTDEKSIEAGIGPVCAEKF